MNMLKINEMNKVIIDYCRERNVFEANRFTVDKKLASIIKKDVKPGKVVEIETYEDGKLSKQIRKYSKSAFVVSYKYDNDGNCINIKKYTNGILESEKIYEYDDFFGRMYCIPTKEINNGKEYEYIYSNNYKNIEKTIYNGIRETKSIITITNEVNNTMTITENAGNSLKIRFFDNSLNGNVIQDIINSENVIYNYDNKDRLTSKTVQFCGAKVKAEYSWNENNEITEETYDCAPYNYTYEYFYR